MPIPSLPKTFYLAALVATNLLPTPASAEPNVFYADVLGWNITAVNNGSNFQGCLMSNVSQDGELTLFNKIGLWELYVPSSQNGTFIGGVLEIDGYQIDSQFGTGNSIASLEISPFALSKLRQGSQLTVRINGDYPGTWSLYGSAAAMLKVQECNQNYGGTPQYQPDPPVRPTPTNPDSGQPTCWVPFAGDYTCEYSELTPQGRFSEIYQMTSNVDYAPSFELQIANEQEIEVYAQWQYEAWVYMGTWHRADNLDGHFSAGSACLEPNFSQGQEAAANLGQDAWGLCVR